MGIGPLAETKGTTQRVGRLGLGRIGPVLGPVCPGRVGPNVSGWFWNPKKYKIKYKIDILTALKGAGYSSYRLRKEKIFGEKTIQDFRAGVPVLSDECLSKLCRLLNLQPGDIIEYTDDYLELLTNGRVLCNSCKKGYIEPLTKDISIEKVNTFVCSNCGEQIHITRKF